MVRDKFKNPLNLDRVFNLSRTMNFVMDFCHRLSIGPVHDKIHGLRNFKNPLNLTDNFLP